MKNKILCIGLLSLFLGLTAIDAKPPKTDSGSFLYGITVNDEDGKPIGEVNTTLILYQDKQVGTLTNYQGTATLLVNRMLTPRDTLEISKPGYFTEKFVFAEDSDGKATITLKVDPNAPAKKAKKKTRK